jgi:ABC-2 type transport system permease protein
MRAFRAVYKREVSHIFTSAIAYGIAFALMLFIGWLFAGQIAVIQQNQQSQIPATDVALLNLDVLTFLLFLVSPLLTMRLLSEESREGTLEVLMTLPMSDWTFVAAKFLAAWTFYTFILLLTLVHVGMLATYAPINIGLAFTSYLGAWLYGGATLAVAYIWSAITDEQIVAAFLGAATVLLFYLIGQLAILVSAQSPLAPLADVMQELSFTAHYQQTMSNGIIRAEDIVFFLLVIGVSLFITTLIVGSRRWRTF